MTTSTATHKPPIAEPEAPPTPDEALVDQRLRRVGRQIKAADIATGLFVLAAASLAYLLVVAVADHWLLPGGLGLASRTVALVGLLALFAYCLARMILPLVLHPVNPLFAAKVIEESRPWLKNSLLNLLFLRRDPTTLGSTPWARHILRGLAHSTAGQLKNIPDETVVDRTAVIRWGYVLIAVLSLTALYLILSPKNLLTSFQRVILPWADIPAPTRVTIESVKPGNTSAVQGDVVTVSAIVEGLREAETVRLCYSTADGQLVNQVVPMTRPEGDYRYTGQLPPDPDGLQQDVIYYVAAGDAQSARFHIRVDIPPTISVTAVHYDYLDYTGLADRVDRQTGDIQAVEGTRVTIRAAANSPIQYAWLEMNADARQRVPMETSGNEATGKLVLRMRADQPTRAQYEWYQVRFRDRSGRENRWPTRHAIQVIPDRPPAIAFADPLPERLSVPADGWHEFRLRAEDPDFALRTVRFRAEHQGRLLDIPPLLHIGPPQRGHEGPFEASYRFQPNQLGLKAGDKVIYWAEAEDNKESWKGPAPNRSETPRRWIEIIAPEKAETQTGQPQPGGQPPHQPQPERPSGQPQPEQPQPPDTPGQQPDQRTQPQQESTEQGEKTEGGQAPADQSQQQQPQDAQGGSEQQSPQAGPSAASDQAAGQGPSENQPAAGGQSQQVQGQQPSGQTQPTDQTGAQSGPGGGDASAGGPSDQRGESAGQQPPDQPPTATDQTAGGPETPGQPPQQTGQAGSETPPADSQPAGSPAPGGQPTGQPQPVDPETDLSEAIHRILEHRAEQEAKQPSGEQQSPEAADQPGGQSQGEPVAPQQGAEPGQGPPQGRAAGPQQGSQSPGQAGGDEQLDVPQHRAPGQPGFEEDANKPPADTPSDNQQQGGASRHVQGESGAGEAKDPNQLSPEPFGRNRPTDKESSDWPRSKEQPRDPTKAQSPSTSRDQSDSRGDADGEMSGGGQQGGGQRANQPGQGPAGTNAPAEQGGSAADQRGEGPTGPGAGNQVPAERFTGQPGPKQQGPDSAAGRPADSPKPGAPPGTQTEPGRGRPADSGKPGGLPNQLISPDQAQGPTRRLPGGGMAGPGGPAAPPPPPQAPDGDQGNLEYARKQTELALEHLQQQLAKQNPELLDRLGWTREDAERFLRKWQRMKQAAAQDGPEGQEAKRRLEETIRGLGLHPPGTQLKSDYVKRHLPNVRDARRFEPPPEWAELVNEYRKSIGSTYP